MPRRIRKVNLSVYVPLDLKRQMDLAAKQEHRTTSQLVAVILDTWLRTRLPAHPLEEKNTHAEARGAHSSGS